MRNFLLFIFMLLSRAGRAQVNTAMPPDANAFYDKAMPLIKPQLKSIITQAAGALKNRRANADSLSKALHANATLKGMSNENITGIATLIMVQASKNADDDLKKMVLSTKNTGNETQEEINDRKQLAVQTIMNRKSKIAEEISLVIKTVSDNKENIINNLK